MALPRRLVTKLSQNNLSELANGFNGKPCVAPIAPVDVRLAKADEADGTVVQPMCWCLRPGYAGTGRRDRDQRVAWRDDTMGCAGGALAEARILSIIDRRIIDSAASIDMRPESQTATAAAQ